MGVPGFVRGWAEPPAGEYCWLLELRFLGQIVPRLVGEGCSKR
jgi:hypothetical protein